MSHPSKRTSEKTTDTISMEQKIFAFKALEARETKNKFDGSNSFGIVKGYASTYGNVDRCNDVVLEGAFDKCMQDYKSKNRQVKIYHQHDSSKVAIGGVRPENITSDKFGLMIEAEINRDVQLGHDVYALVKQGVYSDFSIGYTVNDYEYNKDGQRLLKSVDLWEVSIVGEPANEMAKITEIKTNSKFKFYTIKDLENICTKRDYEDVLRESGAFSKEAATFLAAHFIEKSRSESDASNDDKTLDSLKELTNLINKI